MKLTGTSIDETQSFKVGIVKCYYLEVDEKAIEYNKRRKFGEKPEAVPTGEKIYFMSADVIEKRAGFGKPRYMKAQFSITKEQFEEKPFERGDVFEIFSGCVLDIENFSTKDSSQRTLELVPKKYHKVRIDEKGRSIAYVENKIASVVLRCKQDQYRLFSKKVDKYYYKIGDVKLELAETEIYERVFTFYVDEAIWNTLNPLGEKKSTRAELWSAVKRKKVENVKLEFGVIDEQYFINMLLVGLTKEQLAEKREQKKLEKAEKLRKEQERQRLEAERIAEEQRLESERLAEIKRQEEETLRLKKEQEAIELQKKKRQWEIENKIQVILRPDIGD